VTTTIDARSERSAATRDLLVVTAERLFAERGTMAVSNRMVGEAAGQANNTAVAYHFGTKRGLIAEILRRHQTDIETRRRAMIARQSEDASLRDWIECLIRPMNQHLASLPQPSTFARFSAQVDAEPDLRVMMEQDAPDNPSAAVALHKIEGCTPSMPRRVREARSRMVKQMLIHVHADCERDGVESGEPIAWEDNGVELIDAVTGLWLAPWSTPQRRNRL
jgi:AcrR family transcriptional regulator